MSKTWIWVYINWAKIIKDYFMNYNWTWTWSLLLLSHFLREGHNSKSISCNLQCDWSPNYEIWDIGCTTICYVSSKQAEKLKSREMKEGWMRNDEEWMKIDEGWRLKVEWWRMEVEWWRMLISNYWGDLETDGDGHLWMYSQSPAQKLCAVEFQYISGHN